MAYETVTIPHRFGMLLEYLFEQVPNGEVNDQAIGEIEVFYKASKKRFDDDPEFKKRAQEAVGGDERYLKAWAQICEISRKGFEKVYQRLGIQLVEKGESFYNSYIPQTLDLLRQSNLIEENEGAQVCFTEGKPNPLIVVKRDGGFNYASTDLAALWLVFLIFVYIFIFHCG
ncbi:arginyl-tRNA synthetase, class Ic [Artemisia annua]|uniref:Arginyl-tRNA synthetase, class Ic n=1 Tax=Artemisia annua TaxID=35608 RepID=A0A2U1Q6D1_ARTAN|nr:arginyl-tRNA synthetase, class Ic [Artemisia annua]